MSGVLLVHDTRTSQHYKIRVTDNTVRSSDLTQIKGPIDGNSSTLPRSNDLRIFDPGFENTAIMRSSVTFAEGEQGTLKFRGRRVEDLASDHDFAEVSFLLIWDRLPSPIEKQRFKVDIATVSQIVPQSVIDVIKSFPCSTPYFPMILAGLSAYAGSEPATIPAVMGRNLYLGNSLLVDRSIARVMAAYAVVVGLVHSHRTGHAFRSADIDGSYLSNLFLMMGLDSVGTRNTHANRIRLIEKLWILGADHELTNSTAALLHVASTLADPISCLIGAIVSSYGPLHFGAAESGYRIMQQIGTPENVAPILDQVKAGKQRLMGVGHRVYKNKDPRIEPVKAILKSLKDQGHVDPLVQVAEEIERIVVDDPFFRERRLCVNVDLYWPLIYTSLDIPSEVILPMFIASRTAGFMAHWREAMTQPAKLWRPKQIYVGQESRYTGIPEAKL